MKYIWSDSEYEVPMWYASVGITRNRKRPSSLTVTRADLQELSSKSPLDVWKYIKKLEQVLV